MAAPLTHDRNTLRKYVERIVAEDAQLAATTTIYNGALVAQDGSGNLLPAADTSGLVVLGVARQKMANATGAPAKVSPAASCAAGVFKFDTTGGSAITAADIGSNCYVFDDHTVVRTGGTSHAVVAGIVDSMDSDGSVWVKINC